jgi:hypothetical protein
MRVKRKGYNLVCPKCQKETTLFLTEEEQESVFESENSQIKNCPHCTPKILDGVPTLGAFGVATAKSKKSYTIAKERIDAVMSSNGRKQ